MCTILLSPHSSNVAAKLYDFVIWTVLSTVNHVYHVAMRIYLLQTHIYHIMSTTAYYSRSATSLPHNMSLSSICRADQQKIKTRSQNLATCILIGTYQRNHGIRIMKRNQTRSYSCSSQPFVPHFL